MRIITILIAAPLLMGSFTSEANAVSCRHGNGRAGCLSRYGVAGLGPRGAIAVGRRGAIAVGRGGTVYSYHRGSRCFWRNNQRVCP